MPVSPEPEELEIRVPGLCLAAKAWGRAEAPLVLALHGWLDNASSFDTLAPLLPELRVVALDLPGHGLSEHRPLGQAYHFVDWLPVVFDAADALHAQSFSLMGHSMGAGIAALAAGALPNRVERLVMLEGLGPSVVADHLLPEKVNQHLLQRKRLSQRKRKAYPNVDAAIQALLLALPELSRASAERLVRRGTVAVDGGVTWRADPRLRLVSMHRFSEAQVLAFLRRIEAPSLVVRADRGFVFDREQMRQRCAQVKGLRVHELNGGHHVHLDDAQLVSPAVRELFGLD